MKPGYVTTEFWLSIVAVVLTQLGALNVPDKYKWIVTIGTVVGYAISRGLAKLGPQSAPVIGSNLPPEAVEPLEAELARQEQLHKVGSES